MATKCTALASALALVLAACGNGDTSNSEAGGPKWQSSAEEACALLDPQVVSQALGESVEINLRHAGDELIDCRIVSEALGKGLCFEDPCNTIKFATDFASLAEDGEPWDAVADSNLLNHRGASTISVRPNDGDVGVWIQMWDLSESAAVAITEHALDVLAQIEPATE